MKQRRRDNHCLNCNLRVESIYNYCPQCGQENTNNKVSVVELLKDLYDDYMTLDSRFFKSLKPFILKPGELTNAFNEGHRIKYVHPVRFYLLISLVYFFVFTHVFDIENIPFNKLDKELDDKELVHVYDSIQTPKEKKKALKKIREKLGFIETNIESITDSSEIAILQKQVAYLKPVIDSLEKNPNAIANVDNIKNALEGIIETNGGNEEDFDNAAMNWGSGKQIIKIKKFQRWVQDKNMTDSIFMDSLGIKDYTDFHLKVARQMLKIGRNDLSIFLQTAIDNIPIMMITLLPIMAFFLKIIYIRSSRLYIEHLVFAFHIQSFVYLVLSVFLLLFYLLAYQHIGQFITALWLILTVYIIAMFRNVYKQTMWKTIVKSSLLSFSYFFILVFSLILEVLVSFLVY
jgi:hypothetical protein